MREHLLALTIPGPSGSTKIIAPSGIPSGGYSIGSLASGFMNVAVVLGILVAIVYLVYGGLFWIQSRGDKQKLDKARRIIVFSIIGIVVMALSLVAVNLISRAVGLESITK